MRAPPTGSRDQCTDAGLADHASRTRRASDRRLAEWRGAGRRAPTVLIYGHYDVQPVEPLELWTSPPFEPVSRRPHLRARLGGRQGPALPAREGDRGAPAQRTASCRSTWSLLAEGEEEVGSDHLMPFVEQNAKRLRLRRRRDLRHDHGRARAARRSAVSLRGLAYFADRRARARAGPALGQLRRRGAQSGDRARAHHRHVSRRRTGTCAIPGFYDDVVRAPKIPRRRSASCPFDDEEFREETGARALGGEEGYSHARAHLDAADGRGQRTASGYTGEGSKTVLPAHAMAKVSCRLVPDQDPERIEELLQKHMQQRRARLACGEIDVLHGGKPWRANTEGPLYDAASRALEKAFGKKPVFAGEGGSIPIVPEFERVLGAPVLLMGFGLPGENAHAPDEWMSVENFEKGTHAAAALLQEVAERMKG